MTPDTELNSNIVSEASGTVVAAPPNSPFSVGQRVAYIGPNTYAEYTSANIAHVYPIPNAMPFDIAAAIMLQGLTALSFVRIAYPVQPGDTVLVHVRDFLTLILYLHCSNDTKDDIYRQQQAEPGLYWSSSASSTALGSLAQRPPPKRPQSQSPSAVTKLFSTPLRVSQSVSWT